MSAPKRIQLSRKKGFRLPLNTVVVSRPSKYGNPFVVAPDLAGDDQHPEACKTRTEAAFMYAESLDHGAKAEPEKHAEFLRVVQRELRGKNLACWCPLGERCHADTLLEYANAILRRNPGRSTLPAESEVAA